MEQQQLTQDEVQMAEAAILDALKVRRYTKEKARHIVVPRDAYGYYSKPWNNAFNKAWSRLAVSGVIVQVVPLRHAPFRLTRLTQLRPRGTTSTPTPGGAR